MSEPLELEALYAQAHAALKAKDLARARDLLRQIVVADETYRDASRLLANVIAAQRRRWYNDPRLWGAVGVVILIALGIVLASVLPVLLPAPTPTMVAIAPTATATRAPTTTATATATALPTLTATPTRVPGVTPTPAATAVPLVWKRVSLGQEFPRDSISALVAHPQDPEIFYVSMPNAGIFKTIDGGNSWQPAHKGGAETNLNGLAFDPQDPRTLSGATVNGLYKTTDDGESWQAVVGQGIEARALTEGVSWLVYALDPQTGQHLFFSNTPDKLYETNDGGRTWKQVRTTLCPAIVNIAAHPSQPQTLFGFGIEDGECKGGLYKSADAGKTWTALMPLAIRAGARIAVDRAGKYLYFLSNNELYASSDGGTMWRTIRRQPSVWQMHPENGAVVYVLDANGTLVKTTDGGETWKTLGKPPGALFNIIQITAHNWLWLGGTGLYVSTDDGVTWSERGNGLGATRLELQIASAPVPTFYAGDLTCNGTQNKPLYRSTDAGRAWQLLTDRGCGLAFDAAKNALYRLSRTASNARLLRSQDAGKTWSQGDRIFTATDVLIPDYSVAVNPSTGAIFTYVGQVPFVFTSPDSGVSWQDTNVAEHPLYARFYFGTDQGQTVYLLGRGSYRSGDGGKTWTKCAALDVGKPTYSKLAIDPRNVQRLVAGTLGRGVVTSADGCQTWQPSNTGLGNLFPRSVVRDPQNPERVFVGTDGGAFVSFDGGKSWNQINEGLLGALVIYSIAVDPKDTSVYASTPYGIFKLEQR